VFLQPLSCFRNISHPNFARGSSDHSELPPPHLQPNEGLVRRAWFQRNNGSAIGSGGSGGVAGGGGGGGSSGAGGLFGLSSTKRLSDLAYVEVLIEVVLLLSRRTMRMLCINTITYASTLPPHLPTYLPL